MVMSDQNRLGTIHIHKNFASMEKYGQNLKTVGGVGKME